MGACSFARFRTLEASLAVALGMVLAAGAPAPARAEAVPPAPTGRVLDRAGALTAEEVRALEEISASLEGRTGAELGVLVVPRLSEDDPRSYATKVFAAWGVGKAGRDDGVLILLCLDPRRVEVETGYGLEGALPDARVGALLDEHAVPAFREGRWGAGLAAAATALAGVVIEERAGGGGSASGAEGARRESAAGRAPATRAGAFLAGFAALGVAMAGLALMAMLNVRKQPARLPRLLGVAVSVIPAAYLLWLGFHGSSGWFLAGLAAVGSALAFFGAGRKYRCPRCGARWTHDVRTRVRIPPAAEADGQLERYSVCDAGHEIVESTAAPPPPLFVGPWLGGGPPRARPFSSPRSSWSSRSPSPWRGGSGGRRSGGFGGGRSGGGGAGRSF